MIRKYSINFPKKNAKELKRKKNSKCKPVIEGCKKSYDYPVIMTGIAVFLLS